VLSGAALSAGPAAASPRPYVLYAAQPGAETLDEGHGGGNPFASALVDLLADPGLTLGALPVGLRRLASEKSDGFQHADVPRDIRPAGLLLTRGGLRRTALVAVQSAYGNPGVPQLPGAARDGERITAALARAGFTVRYAPDLARENLVGALEAFATASRHADLALVYATGHGVQSGGVTHLLMPDYLPGRGEARLGERSLTIPRLAEAAQARRANLMLWAGCRSPFTF
jgi:hypothetical protein